MNTYLKGQWKINVAFSIQSKRVLFAQLPSYTQRYSLTLSVTHAHLFFSFTLHTDFVSFFSCQQYAIFL